MSVGRRKRDPLDRYDTPPEATRAFLRAWRPEYPPGAILEPAAGAGLMARELRAAFPLALVDARDIEPRCRDVLAADFLAVREDACYDIVITNPPFIIADRFLARAMQMTRPGGYVILLLRAGFLESRRRRDLLTMYPPSDVYFLRSRPRFRGPNTDGASTDATMYAWFVWRKRPGGMSPPYFRGRML